MYHTGASLYLSKLDIPVKDSPKTPKTPDSPKILVKSAEILGKSENQNPTFPRDQAE